jgi:hypothetical protein
VPCGTLKLKNEFSDLNQGSATDDINTDEKKHDMFLKGLNDEI